VDCNNPIDPCTTSLLAFDRLVSHDHQTPEKRQLAFAVFPILPSLSKDHQNASQAHRSIYDLQFATGHVD